MKKKNFYYMAAALVLIIFFTMGCEEEKPKEFNHFMGYIENTQVNVTTRIPGKITDIYVDEGDYVEANQKVCQLDNESMLHNLEALKTQLKNINKNRKRIQNLYKAGAVPQQKLDEIETAYQVVTSKMLALKSNIDDMTITAPISGIVNVKVLEVGQMMPPGMPVVILTDTSTSWARFSIPETYINQLKLGDKVSLYTGVNGLEFSAVVTQILPMADFATKVPTSFQDERDVRAFSVKLKILDNIEEIKPGMYVYLKLKNPDYKGEEK